ncbi:hypothetical protein Syncc8109_0923 [Synechococcus sp. WH 8109]|nr:hypothetical protein Syncc8109_0923 [Synechococcus sp. WH 8109]
MWSVIDWRFQQREAQGLVLSKGGLQIRRLANHKEPQAADHRAEISIVSDLGSLAASADSQVKRNPCLGRGARMRALGA